MSDLVVARSNASAKVLPSIDAIAVADNFGSSNGKHSIAALILVGVASIGLR
jgi:hypothetical protein